MIKSIIERIKAEFKLTKSLTNLKEHTLFVFTIERIFMVLVMLSPGNLIFGTRKHIHDLKSTDEKWKKISKRRSIQVDFYIFSWALFLVFCVTYGYSFTGMFLWFIRILILIRVYEIILVAINMTLFDHLRIPLEHKMSGVTRTLVLSLWNYLELIICFGILYSTNLQNIKGAINMFDAYYFSAITQLTIGYGDIRPIGILKALAPIQGIIGYIFGILVLARFITLLPKIKPLQGDTN